MTNAFYRYCLGLHWLPIVQTSDVFLLVDRLPITMLFLNWLLIQVVYNVVRFSLDALNSIQLVYYNDYILPHFSPFCSTSISLGSNSTAHYYCCLQVFLVDAKGNSFDREGKIIGFDPAYDLAVLKVYIPIVFLFFFILFLFRTYGSLPLLWYSLCSLSNTSTFRSMIMTYPHLVLEHQPFLKLLSTIRAFVVKFRKLPY